MDYEKISLAIKYFPFLTFSKMVKHSQTFKDFHDKIKTHMEVGCVLRCDVLLPPPAVGFFNFNIGHFLRPVRRGENNSIFAQPQ